MPVNDIVARVYRVLDAMGIEYSAHEHPPIFTGEEAAEHWKDVPGVGIKNLFLRNKKGDRHYLVILAVEKQADLRQLVKVIGDDRLSFGSPDRLMSHLGVTPGSVSVFGLIHEGSNSGEGDRGRRPAVGGAADLPPERQPGERQHLVR